MVAELDRPRDERRQELPPDAAPPRVPLDVEREIRDVLVRAARVEHVEARPAQEAAVVLGDQHGMPPSARPEPGGALLRGALLGLERGHAVLDPLVVDAADRGGVVGGRLADPEAWAPSRGDPSGRATSAEGAHTSGPEKREGWRRSGRPAGRSRRGYRRRRWRPGPEGLIDSRDAAGHHAEVHAAADRGRGGGPAAGAGAGRCPDPLHLAGVGERGVGHRQGADRQHQRQLSLNRGARGGNVPSTAVGSLPA